MLAPARSHLVCGMCSSVCRERFGAEHEAAKEASFFVTSFTKKAVDLERCTKAVQDAMGGGDASDMSTAALVAQLLGMDLSSDGMGGGGGASRLPTSGSGSGGGGVSAGELLEDDDLEDFESSVIPIKGGGGKSTSNKGKSKGKGGKKGK